MNKNIWSVQNKHCIIVLFKPKIKNANPIWWLKRQNLSIKPGSPYKDDFTVVDYEFKL